MIGRLTRDPEVRYSQGENPTAVARYTLAVDRKFKRDGEQQADFINCLAIGSRAEFAEKYFSQGLKISVCGHIQTGSYTNREGRKVYTTHVFIEEQEFCEKKQDGGAGCENTSSGNDYNTSGDGWMDIPDDIAEELPFN